MPPIPATSRVVPAETRETSNSGGGRGYSIVQAGSREEVERLLEGHPHFQAPGAAIEVLEFIPMPASPGSR
jgi:hypothetical protein